VKRLLILCAAVTATIVATGASASVRSARELDAGFHSEALGHALHFRVYLPSDYAGSNARYPVVYFLHGLPAGPTGYRGVGYVEHALDTLGRRAILVAPQGASRRDPDGEYLGRWEQAIARELPRVVDSRFRTIPSRAGRALVGVSAGGYGAMMLALHHLDEYGAVESWSGYFHPTDPAGTAPLDLGSPAANAHASAHAYVPRLRRELSAEPTLIAFYVGDADTRFRHENEQLHGELRRASVPHVFRVYSGGHEQALWAKHAPAWLALALDRLARPE
jgi:enterochelin esterase-like enzyme